MALKNKGGRMLKIALKDSILDIVDREMPELNDDIYSPSKKKDENLASLLSEEDLYSDYDDKGNKTNVYTAESGAKNKNTGVILGVFIITIIFVGFIALLRYLI